MTNISPTTSMRTTHIVKGRITTAIMCTVIRTYSCSILSIICVSVYDFRLFSKRKK